MSTLKSVVDCVHAFLLPCLGFANAEKADAYLDASSTRFDHDVEPCLRTPKNVYVLNAYTQEFSTGLLPQKQVLQFPNARWYILRHKDTSKPEGSYNVGLLFEGPARFYVASSERHHNLGRQNDCFVVWSRSDGTSLQTTWVNGQRKLFAARSGCGLIYARVTHYAKGRPASVTTHVVGVKFTVLDSDSRKDDMLRVEIKALGMATSSEHDNPREPKLPTPPDPVFTQLLKRAREGFEQHCKPIDHEVAEQITYKYDQLAKYNAAGRKPNHFKIIDRLRRTSLQAALNWATEPHRLLLVVQTISGRHEFWEYPPNYIGTTYAHVRKMLKLYRCSPERKDQLWKWVRDFVEPAYGKQWSYTGD